MAAAPSFLDYLAAQKVHPWLSDLAGEALAAHRALDPTVVNRLADAFAEYVDHDYSCERLAGLVRTHGYQVRELPGLFFTVLLPGGEATVFVTGESGFPTGTTAQSRSARGTSPCTGAWSMFRTSRPACSPGWTRLIPRCASSALTTTGRTNRSPAGERRLRIAALPYRQHVCNR